MFSPITIKQPLNQYHFRPSKKLGQHFLINKNVLQKIIEAADLSKQDTILEIGPGLGILTFELAKKAKRIIAVEKDMKMCRTLKDILEKENIKNVEIINQDILKFLLLRQGFGGQALFRRGSGGQVIFPPNYKVVANLPYYIASPVIRLFLEAKNRPQKMILMVQKEVAQRIVAKPPKMSVLAISVQFYAQPEPKIIAYVSKEAFWPKPKVDSAIIQIIPTPLKPDPQITQEFFKTVKAGFAAPRKQLANNLAKNLNIDRQKIENILLQCGLDPKQRAETLAVDNWEKLSLLIYENKL